MFDSILVPVDLAEVEVSRKALQVAEQMAKASKARVRLINVQQFLPTTYMDFVPEDFEEEQRKWATEELSKVAKTIDLPSSQLSTHVRIGGIYPEILAEADEWGADLIIIGSHRPAMSTYLLGSNAKTVVRHAKCSVLVVRD